MALLPARDKGVRRPLASMLLAYLIGIIWGFYCSLDWYFLILIALSLLLGAGISLHRKNAFSLSLLLLCMCTILGALLVSIECTPVITSNHVSNFITDEKLVLEGMLYKSPKIFPSKTRYYVRAKKIITREREITVSGKVLLTVRHSHASLMYGDVVRFLCTIRPAKNFNNPGSFNYREYLSLQGIVVTASLDNKHTIVKVGEFPVNPLLRRVEICRVEIMNFFFAQLTSPAAEIATAIITGEQTCIAETLRERFSMSGVAHLLAISGLHIGIIAMISFTLLKILLRCSTRLMLMTHSGKLAAVMTLVPVCVYCLIAGANIAAIRATLMTLAYMISIIIDRQDDLWNTLTLAAFSILVVSPSSLLDCSFQLSFVSVAAILYLTPLFALFSFKEWAPFPGLRRPWYHRLASPVLTLMMVTLASTLGTAPLVSFYFNRCSPWGIPANLIMVPLTGFLVVPLGLLSSFLLFVYKPLACWAVQIMQAVLNVSIATIDLFSRMPYADCRTVTPTLLEIVLYYSGFLLLFNCRRSRASRFALSVVALLCILNCGYWYYQKNLNPRLRITAIDVGQGEATLLQLPMGKTMLIDGGGSYDNSFDIGGRVVAPLLWRKKIRHIDVLVLSHPHPDHLNGLITVIKQFGIGEVWTCGEAIETETFKEFEKIRKARNIKKAVMVRGYPPAYCNGIAIEFLHPASSSVDGMVKGANDRTNNNSLVMRLIFRDVSILFTGDIYAAAESEIIAAFPDLTSTILKIPHHGSATSSSQFFLEKLSPRIALLNVGRDNYFNLPHPQVIKRYEDMGCAIFRTDMDGAVTVETNGKSVRIRTFLDRNNAIRSYDAL